MESGTGLYTLITVGGVCHLLHVQIYHMLAQKGSPDKARKKTDLLQKTNESLELTLARLSPSEKEVLPSTSLLCSFPRYPSLSLSQFRGRVEEKQEEVKQLLSEEQHHQDIAISLHYDSSPESSLPLPQQASTPTSTGPRDKHTPSSTDKKVPHSCTDVMMRMYIHVYTCICMILHGMSLTDPISFPQ